MPRLSMYRPVKTADYRFIDRTVKEMFTVGGCDIYIHKYAGPKNTGAGDPSQPDYATQSASNIQDLLFLENRDREYEKDVYVMRMVYQEADVDFDLTQFGLFLNGDTKFMVCHYNQMIDVFGRKLMAGDVLEFPNLRDYNPLDTTIQKALPRYYVISDAKFASEGFSVTWLPHLWRMKCTPMAATQEFQDILDLPLLADDIWDPGNFYPKGSIVNNCGKWYQADCDVPPGEDISYTCWREIEPPTLDDKIKGPLYDANDKVLQEAILQVPRSGFDTSRFWILPTYENNEPAPHTNTEYWDVSTSSVLLTLDGLAAVPTIDYTVAANTVQFTTSPTKSQVFQVRCLNLSAPTNTDSQVIAPSGSANQFALTHDTETDSVVVFVGGRALMPTVEYEVIDSVLITQARPAAGTPVEVLYLNITNASAVKHQPIQGNDRYNDFGLWYPTDSNEILVFKNGLLLTPINDYSVEGQVIKFKLIPKNKDHIDVRYIYDPITNGQDITTQTITTAPGVVDYSVRNTGNKVTPRADGYTVGYLTGDGIPPNGEPVTPGVAFPPNPAVGDYCLRLDYFPNRLFRFNGHLWLWIEDDVRTEFAFNEGANSRRSYFQNNPYTTVTSDMGRVPSRESLSQAFKPMADNGWQGGNVTAPWSNVVQSTYGNVVPELNWPDTRPGQAVYPANNAPIYNTGNTFQGKPQTPPEPNNN